MSRNLLLSGGPLHDFDSAGDRLGEMFASESIDTVRVDHPDAAFQHLRAARAGEVDPFDMVTVAALYWRMELARHADLRDRWGYAVRGEDLALLDDFVRGGGGLLALHTAVICFDGDPTWRRLCGAAWDWSRSLHPPLGPAEIRVTPAGRTGEIVGDIDDFVIDDEVYGFLADDGIDSALLTSRHSDCDHPVLWARRVGSGRVVTDLLGHGAASLEHRAHQRILRRAAAWVLGRHPTTAAESRGCR
jgi:uncharacterized protein